MTLCERLQPCSFCPELEGCSQDQERHALWLLDQRLAHIGRRILVLSNKGGVGKSTVTANLAVAMAGRGVRVGLLDADISGPSQPFMFGLQASRLASCPEGLVPAEPTVGLKLVSSGFLLGSPDEALMWRDSYKFQFLLSLLGDTHWGEIDCLLVDMPPGTGGELIGLSQLLGRIDGAIIVTTPQQVAVMDARRAITACREAEIPVLGIIENMGSMSCPQCGGQVHPFHAGGGEIAAHATAVPFLGRIPLDHRLMSLADQGKPAVLYAPESPAATLLSTVAACLLN